MMLLLELLLEPGSKFGFRYAWLRELTTVETDDTTRSEVESWWASLRLWKSCGGSKLEVGRKKEMPERVGR